VQEILTIKAEPVPTFWDMLAGKQLQGNVALKFHCQLKKTRHYSQHFSCQRLNHSSPKMV